MYFETLEILANKQEVDYEEISEETGKIIY